MVMMIFLEICFIHQKKALSSIRNLIDKGKGHLLGIWIYERADKASDETINKKYVEYKPREITEKDEKTAKALGKHVINLYSTGISQWLKIKDVKKLRRDIEMIQSLKIKWLSLDVF